MPIDDDLRYPNTGEYKLERAAKRAYFDAVDAGEPPEQEPAGGIYSERGKLLIHQAATAVFNRGPLACGPGESFWAYDGGVWLPGDKVVNRRIGTLLGDEFSKEKRGNIKAYLIDRIPEIHCEPHTDLINFRNGMLRWTTAELLDADPKYRSVCQLAVEWKPETECPHFDKFVSEVNHPDAVEYFWQLFGYLLVQGNRKQRALFVYGPGSNGKGVWFRTLEKIIGKTNISAVSLKLLTDNMFAGAELHGKLLNMVSDIDPTFIEHTAYFKQVTGGDTVRAERKFQHGFTFTPWCVPVFSGNIIPPSSDPSYGYDRRWSVIDFPNTFEVDFDPDLERRFDDELSGIVFKAVTAFASLKGKEFPLPPSAVTLKQEFKFASDPVARFLSVRTRPPSAEQAETECGEVYAAYKAWCEDEGLPRPLGRNKFYGRVEALNHKIANNGYRFFRDVRLTPLHG